MVKHAGRSVEILEATAVVGSAWRQHYDRLHLHTPKSGSALPGLSMPSSWPRYASRDQVVEYLEHYRDHHRLEPRYGQPVRRLEHDGEAWVARTPTSTWRARTVVVATGAAARPVRPVWPGMDSFRGRVLHSSEYRNGEPWRGGSVLVVGFGNSACEQAMDLVEHGVQTHLSVRSPVNVVPRDVFGVVPVLQLGIVMRHLPPAVADALAKPLLRLTVGDVRRLGLAQLPYGPNTQMARDHRVPMLDIGTMQLIRDRRITVHGALARFAEDGVVLEDGSELPVDAVVLATGFRPALEEFLVDWEAVCDREGRPVHSGAPTALPGLYFCGFFVSPAGMLREAGLEATRIARHVAEQPA